MQVFVIIPVALARFQSLPTNLEHARLSLNGYECPSRCAVGLDGSGSALSEDPSTQKMIVFEV